MTDRRQRLGRWGEALACQYLAGLGYSIVEQNVRTKYGEIDIIACQPDGTLVFVEVKTRRSTVFGPPEVSVDAVKKSHLLASIQSYLVEHPDITGGYRLDVIAIQAGADNQPPEILHFENASPELTPPHNIPGKGRLIVLVGPTAVGKTEAAVQLALRLSGEVISADSRLFYRGMDIGTDRRWRCIELLRPTRLQRQRFGVTR